MSTNSGCAEDEVFLAGQARHLMTMGFLQALLTNFDADKAFDIAAQGFANYMITYYQAVLGVTPPNSQERFDAFRRHYQSSAAGSPYCSIVESTSTVLQVCYSRCVFFEVAKKYKVEDLTYAFCLSDPAFTRELLPGVEFRRTKEIATGCTACDHMWIWKSSKE